MPYFLAIGIQKGGVGKSTLTQNLAGACAGFLGLHTVVLDFDAQANTSRTLLGGHRQPNLEGVLRGEVALPDALVPCHFPTLSVLPGSKAITGYEMGAHDPSRPEFILDVARTFRLSAPVESDLVLIDTPPGGGIWLQTGLALADGYLAIAWPDGYSAEGLVDLADTARAVRTDLNPRLTDLGLVVNYLRQTNESKGYLEIYRDIYRERLLQVIPARASIGQARDQEMPVERYERLYRTSNPAAPVFRQLAERIAGALGIGSRRAVTQLEVAA